MASAPNLVFSVKTSSSVACVDHYVESASIETAEGIFVGYCTHCSHRVRIERIPGGHTAVRVRSLLYALADDWNDLTALILEHGILKDYIKKDVEALRSSVALMYIASDILAAGGMSNG